MFLSPVKKSKSYVCEIRTKQGKPFLLKLYNVNVQDMFRLKETQGHLLHVAVPSDTCAHETIRTLDELALQETLQRKSQWFPNSRMSKEKVLEYFRPSLTYSSNVLNVLVSESKEPSSIEWHGEAVECFEKLLQKGKRTIREASATFVVEAHGLYFYEQKFGIRWILRSISFSKPNADEDSVEHDVVSSDKAEIEGFWRSEVAGMHESIDKDIELLREKIRVLEREKEEVAMILEDACEIDEISPSWNSQLEQLRERIARYQSGML